MLSERELAEKYPDAHRMAPTYQPLFTSESLEWLPGEFERRREEGLRRLQHEIDAGLFRRMDVYPFPRNSHVS